MKYIIDRSCSYKGAPIKEAKQELVHFFDCIGIGDISDRQEWERFKMTHTDITFKFPFYSGFNCEPEMAWVAEIDDLQKLVEREREPIILSEPNNAEGYWNIEIYDGFRE